MLKCLTGDRVELYEKFCQQAKTKAPVFNTLIVFFILFFFSETDLPQISITKVSLM